MSISTRNGPVGHQPADGQQVELEDGVDPELAAAALIRDGRVEVPVADDRRAALERGSDHLVDVLRARREVERGLGPRRDVVAVEDEVTDLLAERRAARLAGRDDVDAVRGQRLGEELCLGRLAAAVETLERDEHRGS